MTWLISNLIPRIAFAIGSFDCFASSSNSSISDQLIWFATAVLIAAMARVTYSSTIVPATSVTQMGSTYQISIHLYQVGFTHIFVLKETNAMERRDHVDARLTWIACSSSNRFWWSFLTFSSFFSASRSFWTTCPSTRCASSLEKNSSTA